MKTKNFPAKKVLRKIQADLRATDGYGSPGVPTWEENEQKLRQARAVRTKVQRGSRYEGRK